MTPDPPPEPDPAEALNRACQAAAAHDRATDDPDWETARLNGDA